MANSSLEALLRAQNALAPELRGEEAAAFVRRFAFWFGSGVAIGIPYMDVLVAMAEAEPFSKWRDVIDQFRLACERHDRPARAVSDILLPLDAGFGERLAAAMAQGIEQGRTDETLLGLFSD